MQIYDILKDDHDRLRALMARIESTTERAMKSRLDLFRELKNLLNAHTKAEEAIFYRTLMADDATYDQTMESLDEHKSSEAALDEIEDTDPKSVAWIQRFRFFKRSLERHFEEEEKDLFKKLRKVVSRDEAVELGDRFREMKSDIFGDLGT